MHPEVIATSITSEWSIPIKLKYHYSIDQDITTESTKEIPAPAANNDSWNVCIIGVNIRFQIAIEHFVLNPSQKSIILGTLSAHKNSKTCLMEY